MFDVENNRHFAWIVAIKSMKQKSYWTKANTVEFWAFATKLLIIFPGLLFGAQFWWLYIFALVSSLSLIWSSTVKTLPTIILFNMGWSLLAILSLCKYFFSW
jgi:hypothetical protein